MQITAPISNSVMTLHVSNAGKPRMLNWNPTMIPSYPRRAFTLMELLVVISIIALLAAMLLPAIGLVRDSARQTKCLGLQRQLQLANVTYVNDNDGMVLPQVITTMPANYLSWSRVRAFTDLFGLTILGGPNYERDWTSAWLCPSVQRTPYILNSSGNIWCFDKGPWVYNLSALYRPDPAGGSWLCGMPELGLTNAWGIYSMPLARLPQQSQKVAWAEGEGWNVGFHGTYTAAGSFSPMWIPKIVEQSMSMPGDPIISYTARHRGRMNVVYWDGHGGSLERRLVDADGDVNKKVDLTPDNLLTRAI